MTNADLAVRVLAFQESSLLDVRAEARTLLEFVYCGTAEAVPFQSSEKQPQILRLAALAQDDSVVL
jgi:hypothetical protein